MQTREGVIGGVSVLACGLALAALFYKDQPFAGEAAMQRDQPIHPLKENGLRFLMEVPSAQPLTPSLSEPAPTPANPARPLDRLTGLPLFEAGGDRVPQLAQRYPPPEEDSPKPAWIEHRVNDGDTLAILAQRYLKDAARQQEIFDANRDVLSNPDLLPIGAVLKIPSK